MRGYAFPPEARPLSEWWDKMKFASSYNGRSMEYRQQELQLLLENMGFSNFTHQTVSIPLLRFPEGAWEKHLVECFLCALMGTGTNAMTEPLVGLSMSLFTRTPPLQLSEGDVLRLCSDVCGALRKGLAKDTPVYYNLYVACRRVADCADDD